MKEASKPLMGDLGQALFGIRQAHGRYFADALSGSILAPQRALNNINFQQGRSEDF
ncbi:MAG TPA: hypothetical protein H9774_08295 [Candidatus Desulfovibrio gallistercoris]|nr:hypothetical protein [Candidatus Desulfovibrio gallistercoris]